MNTRPTKEFIAGLNKFKRDYLIEVLAENDALLADGFEEALIGHTQGANVVAVYDYDTCVATLIHRDGMTIEDAVEFMEFNVVGSYVGDKTPVFISYG